MCRCCSSTQRCNHKWWYYICALFSTKIGSLRSIILPTIFPSCWLCCCPTPPVHPPYNLCVWRVLTRNSYCRTPSSVPGSSHACNHQPTHATRKDSRHGEFLLHFRCVPRFNPFLTMFPLCEYIYKNCCLDYPPASCVEQCSRERTTRVHPLAQTTKRSFNTSLPLWALCAVHGNCGEVATPARTLRGIPKLYSLFIPGSPRTHTRSTLMTHRRTLLNGLCSYIYQLISPEYDNSHHRRQLVWLICLSSRYKKNPPRPRPPPITIFL